MGGNSKLCLMAKPPGPRPIIVDLAKPFGLEITKEHWSRGSTVTTKFFEDLFTVVVGRAYDGKIDKRSIAEALLLKVGGSSPAGVTINESMFSKGGTVTNSYFKALKEALEDYRRAEQDGVTIDNSQITQKEIQEAAEQGHEGNFEGRKQLVIHYRRERSKALSASAKKLARKGHPEGLLACEICLTVPEKTYQEDIIEAHHRLPLNNLSAPVRVMPQDLAMICPSCHRAVHKVDNCSMPEVAKRLRAAGVIKQ